MLRFFWICLGGAAGTGARHALSGRVLAALGTGFPYGTLAVNVIGSFLLGAIMQVALGTNAIPPALRLALTTGSLGGFTTYSTFNYETLRYFQSRASEPGASSNTSHVLRLSEDLPVVIEVVDTEERVERLLPIPEEMVSEGLVTLEKARVVKYAPGRRPLDSSRG